TTVIAPATSEKAINPSELIVRGAALQAFLIEGFEPEDVEQSTHPAVTVTPHLANAIGLVIGNGDFTPIIPAETPLPVRRTVQFKSTGAGDSLIKLAEGLRDIKVTKPEAKTKTNGANKAGDDSDADEEDEDDEDEEEEIRERTWKVGNVLGELALKELKKDAKVTLQISVNSESEVTVSAQEVGAGKTGVRGVVPGQESANGTANGSAH
ncbi:MAG: hypothetical protein ACRYGR_00360, partial [Janthinobacterium lividum]